MQIKVAKTAGFCFGVKRAVETVYEQAETNRGKKVYTYGPIIHNEIVVNDLRQKRGRSNRIRGGAGCVAGWDCCNPFSWCSKTYL